MQRENSSYIMEGASDKEILLFGMPEEVGALAKALDIFKVNCISLSFIFLRKIIFLPACLPWHIFF